MDEAVASDEPQIAPNPAEAPIAAVASPPRRWPTKVSAARNRALDRPPRLANSLIKRNSGMIEKE